MSADNGIYIAGFGDGEYRVIHAQAIDNCWYPNGENSEFIVDYFKDSFKTYVDEDAVAYAIRLGAKIDYLEYGIAMIKFSHPFLFYEQKLKEKNEIPSNTNPTV